MSKILDIHADDLGVSISSSADILALCHEQLLDSVSIIPNMSAWDFTVSEFKKLDILPKVSIHLNFMEGHCCCKMSEIPDLVDSKGYFKISWGQIFLKNYNPFIRKKLRKELTKEILAQTEKCISAGIVKPDALRFDSHQHPHMIPVVQDALFDAVDILEKAGNKVEFIRNTQELWKPYFSSIKHSKISLANIIKCIILNFYSARLKKILCRRKLPVNFLCGVFFSGMMTWNNIADIIKPYERLASEKGYGVEILFHPGTMKKEEITEEFVKPGFVGFHISRAREQEYQSVRKIGTLKSKDY